MIRTEVQEVPVAQLSSVPVAEISGRKTLRVLHVLPFFAYGGTELVVQRLISSLDAPEFEHHICAMRGFDQGLVRAAHLDGRILQAGDSGERFQFPLFRLVRIMRKLRPHIVHTRNWGALEAILAARISGVPATVHSEHGYDLDMLSRLPWRRRVIRKSLYSLTDRLFTVSNELRDYHAQQAGISQSRIKVLYNGVDTERFAPRNEVRASMRAQFGIPAESIVVGSVGRMVAIKDYPLTLLTVSELIRQGRNIHLLLVGAGPELPILQQLANECSSLNGRVRFCGFAEQIPALLNAMDIFVQSSRAEGMSNTLLEAMASGLPIVATDVGGNPEVLTVGQTGWLFPPGDAQALANKVDQLIGSAELRHQMGLAGRNRALQEFSVGKMLGEYRKLYHELAISRGILAAREA
jgi:sugar transferase (PEP-CTERM/EpsH1 system associated)